MTKTAECALNTRDDCHPTETNLFMNTWPFSALRRFCSWASSTISGNLKMPASRNLLCTNRWSYQSVTGTCFGKSSFDWSYILFDGNVMSASLLLFLSLTTLMIPSSQNNVSIAYVLILTFRWFPKLLIFGNFRFFSENLCSFSEW